MSDKTGSKIDAPESVLERGDTSEVDASDQRAASARQCKSQQQ